MAEKNSQRKIIERKLKEQGYVDNVWAFNNYILRLGAIIHELRQDGWEIDTNYKNETGHRNCHYILVKAPELKLF